MADTIEAGGSGAAPEVTTLLGRGSEFSGKLTFEGAVRIDGQFSGEILSEGTLVVGPDAVIAADVDVTAVIVQGTVKGNITAAESIEIRAPGRVEGKLVCPQLYVEKGVIFNGSCEMPAKGGSAAGAGPKGGSPKGGAAKPETPKGDEH